MNISPFVAKKIMNRLMLAFLAIALGIASAYAYNKLRVIKKTMNDEVRLYENKLFPKLNITNYQESADLSSTLQNGKFLLVYVLSNCGGCELELEVLQKSKLTTKTNIQIIFVSIDEIETLKNFIHKYDFNSPVFYDKNLALKNALEIEFTPANYLIENGQIKRSWFGSPLNEADLYKKLGYQINSK